ncbi:unnamed protein product [Pleuronectes platessa]|uniref:Uncharacterized protein n=1 Tax=Pleuronectes platessa TaxID=8262 RepID=A0A9N7VW74_PLEPL|nr:unnamed protein product [Pleuronectes platessa]
MELGQGSVHQHHVHCAFRPASIGKFPQPLTVCSDTVYLCSDCGSQSGLCGPIGGGPGMENAHDNGEEASADLGDERWRIVKERWGNEGVWLQGGRQHDFDPLINTINVYSWLLTTWSLRLVDLKGKAGGVCTADKHT